jgi:pyrrolysyl-tRNA synthetase-like protein
MSDRAAPGGEPAPDQETGGDCGFTVTQQQRLRELGAHDDEIAGLFPGAGERDDAYKSAERELVQGGRRHLATLLEGERRPALRSLESALSEALRAAGLVEVVTPHIITRDALEKMGIPRDDPLSDQIFWIDGRHCLRPMLAPNLYTVMRRLTRTWKRPFAIFEVGACFRRDSQGSRHLDEFTMLNLVELGTAPRDRRSRLEELAALVLGAAGISEYELVGETSGVYGDTVDVLVGGLEVCSAAMGPHPLDDAWGVTDPWVGLGFGLERLLVARDAHPNIERVARSLSYLDGVRLFL